MAALFRKRKFKPWLLSSINSNNRKLKSKVVKVLCRRSKTLPGAHVMLVADGDLSITAVFTDEAVNNATQENGMDASVNWSTALVILQDFTLELNPVQGPEGGEYVLYVNRFSIWDLQPGYYAKYDYQYCMKNEEVIAKMREELAERAAHQTESSMSESVPLSQLLEEMAKQSTSSSELQGTTDVTPGTSSVSESLLKKLKEPMRVDEFIVPKDEAAMLDNIKEWQPDYQPSSSPSLDPVSSTSSQQFDVCVINTLADKEQGQNKTSNREKSSAADVKGIEESNKADDCVKIVELEKDMGSDEREEDMNVKHIKTVENMQTESGKMSNDIRGNEKVEAERNGENRGIENCENSEVGKKKENTCSKSKGVIETEGDIISLEMRSSEKRIAEMGKISQADKIAENVDAENNTCGSKSNKNGVGSSLSKNEEVKCGQDLIYLGISVASSPEEIATKPVTPRKKTKSPTVALFKPDSASQSQGTMSQWHEEQDSVRFSFEETSSQSALGSQCVLPEVEFSKTVDSETKTGNITENIHQPKSVNVDYFVTNVSNAKVHIVECVSETISRNDDVESSSKNQNELSLIESDNEKEKTKANTTENLTSRIEKKNKNQNRSAKENSPVTNEKQPKHPTKSPDVNLDVRNEKQKENMRKGRNEEIAVNDKQKENPIKSFNENLPVRNEKEKENPKINTDRNVAVRNEKQKPIANLSGDENVAIIVEKQSENYLSVHKGSQLETENTGSSSGKGSKSLFSHTSDENDSLVIDCLAIGSPKAHSTQIDGNDNVQSSELNSQGPVVDILGTSSDEKSHDSQMDMSVMIDYYSQGADVTQGRWNNVLVRLAEKKKKLEALKYISERIAKVSTEPAKSVDSDKSESPDLQKSVEKDNADPQKRNNETTNECNDQADESTRNLAKDTNAKYIEPQNMDSLTENTQAGHENIEGEISIKVRSDLPNDDSEQSNVICNEAENIETEITGREECSTQQATCSTTDTGYPVSSMSLREAFEESENCQLPGEFVENVAPRKSTSDLEATTRMSTSDSGRNEGKDLDQTDLGLIDKELAKYIKAQNQTETRVSKSTDLTEKGTCKENKNRLAPEYFDAEIGSKRRSKRLFKKVISCRERDFQITEGNETSNSSTNAGYEHSNAKADANKNRKIAKDIEDKHKSWKEDELGVCCDIMCVESNAGKNMMDCTESVMDVSKQTIQNQSIDRKTTPEKANKADKVLLTNNLKNNVSESLKEKSSNRYKEREKKERASNVVKHGHVTTDAYVLLGRIDGYEKKTNEKVDNDRVDVNEIGKKEVNSKTATEINEDINNKVQENEGVVVRTLRSGVKTRKKESFCTCVESEISPLRSGRKYARKTECTCGKSRSSLSKTDAEKRLKQNSTNLSKATSTALKSPKQHNIGREPDGSVTGIKSRSNTRSPTFEDQFKTWLENDAENCDQGVSLNSSETLSETSCSKLKSLAKNKRHNSVDNSVVYEDYDSVSVSTSKCGNITVEFKKHKQDDIGEQQHQLSVPESPVEGTQPFDIQEFPQTQEFSPKLIDTLIELSQCDSFTNSTGHNENADDNLINECSVSDSAIHPDVNLNIRDTQTKLANKNHFSVGKESNETNVGDKLNRSMQVGQAQKSSVSKSENKISEGMSNDTFHESVEIKKGHLEDKKDFTKIVDKPNQLKMQRDLFDSLKPYKLNFRVKPIEQTDTTRKRKLNRDISVVSSSSKRPRHLSDSRVGNRNGCKVKRSYVLGQVLDEGAKQIDTPKRGNNTPSATELLKRLGNSNIGELNTGDDTGSEGRSTKLLKTYQPKKMIIDGHFFGNQVFWQNFIKSPYKSKSVACETKTKPCMERTNKRKQSLDSSQGSQDMETAKKSNMTSKEADSEKLNNSSGSLFSDENCVTDSGSVSLLQNRKTESKNIESKTSLRNKKLQANDEIKHIGSDELRYTRKDGVPKFYRTNQKRKTNAEVQSETKHADAAFRTRFSSSNGKKISTGKKSMGKEGNSVNCEESKAMFDKTHQKDRKSTETALATVRSLSESKASFDKGLDKQLFIEEWLMKHKDVNVMELSPMEQLSTPDHSPQESHLSSHLPASSNLQPKLRNRAEVEKPKDNDDDEDRSNSSEMTSSSDSEDTDKHMSAARRYLLKLKHARHERKREQLATLKSNHRQRAQNYLKSCNNKT